jgi:hypothetical protein
LNTLTVGELDAEGNPTVSQGADELSIDKNVIIADVTVNF